MASTVYVVNHHESNEDGTRTSIWPIGAFIAKKDAKEVAASLETDYWNKGSTETMMVYDSVADYKGTNEEEEIGAALAKLSDREKELLGIDEDSL